MKAEKRKNNYGRKNYNIYYWAIFGAFFNSIGEDFWKYLKKIFNYIKKYVILFIKARKIYNEYKKLKISNQKYKEQVKQYNIHYEEWCREYYINQIKEKYGDELCTQEILYEKWLDDNNNWNENKSIEGIYIPKEQIKTIEFLKGN